MRRREVMVGAEPFQISLSPSITTTEAFCLPILVKHFMQCYNEDEIKMYYFIIDSSCNKYKEIMTKMFKMPHLL